MKQNTQNSTYITIKVKWSRYRPGVAQRVGRGIALLFHDRGTRRGWVVNSTPRPHFTPGKDPVPIVQEAGWAPGPVWTGGKSRPHRDSVPDRPSRSQSLYRLSYPTHYITIRIHKYNNTRYTIYKIKQKHTKHKYNIYIYIYSDKKWNQKNTKKYDNRKTNISSKLHMIYVSSNNVRHPVPKTFTTLHPTTLHYTCRHVTSCHLNFTQLHFTTLSFGLTRRDMVEGEDFSLQIPRSLTDLSM